LPTAAAEVTRAAPTYLTSNSLRFTAGLIKHILRDERGWRFDIALCLVAASLAEGLGVATLLPLIMLATHGEHSNTHFGRAFESALQTIGLSAEVPILIGLMILAISLKAGLLLIAMRHVGALVAKSTTELRLALIRGQLNTEWKHFARQRLGRVAHSIGTEPQRGCMAYLHSAHLFADLAQCAVYLDLALLVSWRLAILALLIGSSALFLLHLPVRRAKWAARQQSGMTTSLTGLLADTLAGIKPLKATAKIDLLGSQLERQTHEMESVTRRVLVTSQAIPVLQEPVLAILTNLAMILAATTLHEPIHNILLMGTILYRVSGKIARAQRNYLSAVTFGQILERLQDGLEKTHEAAERNEGSFAPTLEHGVEFRDANFSHARKPVLSQTNLNIPAGKMTVLFGPSGVGKTTLIDLLTGLHRVESGSILVDGVPLEQLDLTKWREMMGYVSQDFLLFHDSILNNVTLGDPSISEARVRKALEAAEAWDFIQALPEGLATVVAERGAALSGGQRQRIALARALIFEPSLLILDEATAALDEKTEQAVIRNLRQWQPELTLLVVSHQKSLTKLADHVVHLREGAGARDLGTSALGGGGALAVPAAAAAP
jgi:ATP-binding cassette, subfamily C, bacterial